MAWVERDEHDDPERLVALDFDGTTVLIDGVRFRVVRAGDGDGNIIGLEERVADPGEAHSLSFFKHT